MDLSHIRKPLGLGTEGPGTVQQQKEVESCPKPLGNVKKQAGI